MSARATDPSASDTAEASGGSDRLVVAIDGPSGSGKSTIARQVAAALGVRYLDTGAMYRAATWWVLERGIDPGDASTHDEIVEAVRGIVLVSGTDPRSPSIAVGPLGDDPIDVTSAVRSAKVTAAVSAVSAIPAIREFLVSAQRVVIGDGGIVVEGRDIGTTVWPAAPVKVYLTASEQARAARRSSDGSSGPAPADAGTVVSRTSADDVQRVLEELARRDTFDSTRAVSPLTKAPDAVVVDSTGLDITTVVARVLALVRERTGIGFGDDLAPRTDAEPFQRAVMLGVSPTVVITDRASGGLVALADYEDRVAR